jgi:hypothetical protein
MLTCAHVADTCFILTGSEAPLVLYERASAALSACAQVRMCWLLSRHIVSTHCYTRTHTHTSRAQVPLIVSVPGVVNNDELFGFTQVRGARVVSWQCTL